jgi:hypothetical protein
MAMTLLVFTACALTVAHADGARAETAAHAPKEAEGGADGVASNADEDAEMEALFRAKREKKRLAQEEKRRAQDAARAHAAQEADEALRAQHEQARAEAAEAEKERIVQEQRKRKFELQQEEVKRREREKTERARKEQQALKSPEDPRDAPIPGELDELELERQAFERAERAVRDEEARQEAMKFAEEEAAAAEELSRQALERARNEAQRLFNEQDLQRRRRGKPQGDVAAAKTYPEPPLRCALCPVVVIGARGRTGRAVIEKLLSLGESVVAVARAEVPGVVSVPRWFAELMSKARFRGIGLEWDVADVTEPKSLDRVFAGAKAVVFAVTATPSSAASKARQLKYNSAEAVDNIGLSNVARKAGEHAVERLIIISQAGVTRPVVSSLSKALWGTTWSDVGKAMHWNLLKHKRLGELAAIRECRETRGETTYTIIRATNFGNSTFEGAWRVEPESISTFVGDNVDVSEASTSRAQVAALAVEAIFTEAAINRVVEVVARSEEDMAMLREAKKDKSNTGSSDSGQRLQGASGVDTSRHEEREKPREEAGKDAGKDEREKKEVCSSSFLSVSLCARYVVWRV